MNKVGHLSPTRILVTFEHEPQSTLIIPERFMVQDDEEGSHYAVTTDRRLINPQLVNILQDDHHGLTGKKAFVHYGASEVCEWLDTETAFLKPEMIFFFIEPDGTLTCSPNTYLGETILNETVRTESGIYLTPDGGEIAVCRVRLNRIPAQAHELGIGDEVITIDNSQYMLKYGGRKYVKLKYSEIVAVIRDGEAHPVGQFLLIEQADSAEQVVDNSIMREFVQKHRIYAPGSASYLKDQRRKETTTAKLCREWNGHPAGTEFTVWKNQGFEHGGKRIVDEGTLIWRLTH